AAHRVLLRVRRALSDGGRRRQGRGPCQHRPHRRRHRRLEESRRTGADGVRIRCRPCERRDPYSVTSVVEKKERPAVRKNYRRWWFWIPAFAGTTEKFSRTSSADPLQLRNQHIQRFREHYAATHGQPVRDDDALLWRIE